MIFEFSLAGYRGDDLAAVETTVLDEDSGGLQPADHYARQINSRDVAFECFGIERGTFGCAIELNALFFEETEIGVITRQREDLPCGNSFFAAAIFDAHLRGLDGGDLGVKHGANFARADAIFDVGFDPIF